jgi:hypothetical protein
MTNPSFNSRHGQSTQNPSQASSPGSSPSPVPLGTQALAAGAAGDVSHLAGAPPESAAAAEPASVVEAEAVKSTQAVSPELSTAEHIALALSPSQVTAIEKMLAGNTLVASASAAGVTRMTLYTWLHHDAKFRAAYNAWQLDAITRVRTKILSMTDAAADSVGEALKSDPRLAFSLLKALGSLDRPTPGSTNPTEVAQLMEIDRLKAESDLGEKLFWASIGSGVRPPKPGQKPTNAHANALIQEMEKEKNRKPPQEPKT